MLEQCYKIQARSYVAIHKMIKILMFQEIECWTLHTHSERLIVINFQDSKIIWQPTLHLPASYSNHSIVYHRYINLFKIFMIVNIKYIF